MEESTLNIFRSRNLNITEEDIKMMNPLALAYVGDGVYELLIRTYLLDPSKNVNKLHRESSKFVKAASQSQFADLLKEELTKEESSVYSRGRNAKSHTVPKNARLSDYRNATGFEALFGYLYLLKRDDRIVELFKMIEEAIDYEG